MALRISLDCPIDGLAITTNAPLQTVGQGDDTHVHVKLPAAVFQCANGHRWRFENDDAVLLRVGG